MISRNDILNNIAGFLNAKDLSRFVQTSRRWQKIGQHNQLWLQQVLSTFILPINEYGTDMEPKLARTVPEGIWKRLYDEAMLDASSWQIHLGEWLAADETRVMADEILGVITDPPCPAPKFRRELEIKDTVIQDLLANGWDSVLAENSNTLQILAGSKNSDTLRGFELGVQLAVHMTVRAYFRILSLYLQSISKTTELLYEYSRRFSAFSSSCEKLWSMYSEIWEWKHFASQLIDIWSVEVYDKISKRLISGLLELISQIRETYEMEDQSDQTVVVQLNESRSQAQALVAGLIDLSITPQTVNHVHNENFQPNSNLTLFLSSLYSSSKDYYTFLYAKSYENDKVKEVLFIDDWFIVAMLPRRYAKKLRDLRESIFPSLAIPQLPVMHFDDLIHRQYRAQGLRQVQLRGKRFSI